ncbi:DegT/DnrJ/EryC1/StrS family aminotransferase [Peribacillus asahii]|uniref:DegT/DnrJ/EryC1/StrS family aminotransferase n=1 Tax=Peribacillus asahii TaxID=228899 RepID=UPI00257D5C41|nr:DegT/DnrJ/EryC1/StrS family aminotransferase [Peribacillus asahii]
MPDIGEEEINEVVDSLKSGWLTTGKKTKLFEEQFAEFLGEEIYSVAVNSATAGMHLALEAIGIKSEDEVITTPYTFTATAEVIRYFGAHPVFVDIDPSTFNIDVNQIEKAITSKTKAIMPVHFAGLSCQMDEILRIAKKYNLKVIEDAAHALPTTYNGNLIGTLNSDATVFSFYATKTLATGEGGMLVTKDKNIAERCKNMRLHGINRDVFDRYTSTKPSWYYEVIAPGYKYNMTDIAASIGIQQLKKLWSFQKVRQKMATIYDNELADLPIILPPKPINDTHSWHLYIIQLNTSKVSRDEFISKMAENGVGCSVHFIPLHLHPYWKNTYQLHGHDFPNSLNIYNNVVSLPIYTKMTDQDQQKVIDSIKKILQ